MQKLKEFEKRINRVVEIVETLSKENEELKKEIERLKDYECMYKGYQFAEKNRKEQRI